MFAMGSIPTAAKQSQHRLEAGNVFISACCNFQARYAGVLKHSFQRASVPGCLMPGCLERNCQFLDPSFTAASHSKWQAVQPRRKHIASTDRFGAGISRLWSLHSSNGQLYSPSLWTALMAPLSYTRLMWSFQAVCVSCCWQSFPPASTTVGAW